MTPIGLADEIRNFGTIFGQLIALKPQAAKYPQTYSQWTALVNKGENLRQTVTAVQNMGAVSGQLETFIAGIFGSLFPDWMLPSGINKVNLYAISGWEADVKSFMTQLQQVNALEQTGLTYDEVSNAIKPTDIGTTVTGAAKSVLTGVGGLAVGVIVIGGIYLYFKNKRGRK